MSCTMWQGASIVPDFTGGSKFHPMSLLPRGFLSLSLSLDVYAIGHIALLHTRDSAALLDPRFPSHRSPPAFPHPLSVTGAGKYGYQYHRNLPPQIRRRHIPCRAAFSHAAVVVDDGEAGAQEIGTVPDMVYLFLMR